ncbi:MAG: hypothetical protein GY696_04785 [Gammaproteobacteria bacterium]|nr:hypothetical protein [Gammaproteobacteria bacterium]
MTPSQSRKTVGIWFVTIVAVAFGLMTIKSGGTVLFIDGEFRQQAGNYVPFVVWFNFLAGFAYIVAGIGIWKQQQWGAWLALTIAAASMLAFVILGFHINSGGSYETRTVIAVGARCTIWSAIGLFSFWTIGIRAN